MKFISLCVILSLAAMATGQDFSNCSFLVVADEDTAHLHQVSLDGSLRGRIPLRNRPNGSGIVAMAARKTGDVLVWADSIGDRVVRVNITGERHDERKYTGMSGVTSLAYGEGSDLYMGYRASPYVVSLDLGTSLVTGIYKVKSPAWDMNPEADDFVIRFLECGGNGSYVGMIRTNPRMVSREDIQAPFCFSHFRVDIKGRKMYAVNETVLYVAELDGSEYTQLYASPSGVIRFIAVGSDAIYLTKYDDNFLYSISKDGREAKPIMEFQMPGAVAIVER